MRPLRYETPNSPKKVFSWIKDAHMTEQVLVKQGVVAVSLEDRLESKRATWAGNVQRMEILLPPTQLPGSGHMALRMS